MGGIQVRKTRKWQVREDTEEIETCLNVNVKNNDNINYNLVLPTKINIRKSDVIADSGCTIQCLSEKYIYNNNIYNAKLLRSTQPFGTIIESNFKCDIKVSTLTDK